MLQLWKIERTILINETTKSQTIVKGKKIIKGQEVSFFKKNYMLLEIMSKTGIQNIE